MGKRWLALAGVSACLVAAFFGAHFFAPSAEADPGQIQNIAIYDVNANGYVDRVKLFIDDPSEETWVLAGAAPYSFSVSRAGNNVTITGVSIDTTHVDFPGTAVVTIDLDETDPDLSDAFDTGQEAVELVYASQAGGAACTNCVHGSSAQLVDIPVGDGEAGNMESDAANPQIVSSTTLDQNGDGYIDALEVTFSESVHLGDGESSNAGMFTAQGDSCVITMNTPSNHPAAITHVLTVTSDVLDTGCLVGVTYSGSPSIRGLTGADNLQADAQSWTNADGAHPVAYRTVARDQNKDGTLDKLDVYFSEPVTVTDGETQVESTLALDSAVNHLSAACTPSVVSGNYAASSVTSLTLDIATVEQDTGCLIPVTIVGEGNILDAANLSVVNDAVSATVEEDAPPILLSVGPTPDQTGVAVDTAVTFVFSEAMDIGFDYGTQFTVSPNPAPGTWNGTWTDEYHLSQAADGAFDPGTTYTVTLTPSQIHALGGTTTDLLTVGTALGGEWSFTTAGGGGGGGGSSNQVRVGPARLLAEGISLKAPASGSVLDADSTVLIKWVPVGLGRIDAVNLSWSPDGGLTWEDIVRNHPNGNGSYPWNVPARSTDAVLLRVEATDTSAAYATDVSDDYLSIRVPGVRLPEAEPLLPGTLIKAEGLPAVYYLAENGTRRPFPDERVFHTWFETFDGVKELPVYRIARYRMGAPMLPKPGTAFLRINSDPKLYWIDRVDGRAHWVKSESTATILAGPRWQDMVIDLGATIFPSVLFGNPIE